MLHSDGSIANNCNESDGGGLSAIADVYERHSGRVRQKPFANAYLSRSLCGLNYFPFSKDYFKEIRNISPLDSAEIRKEITAIAVRSAFSGPILSVDSSDFEFSLRADGRLDCIFRWCEYGVRCIVHHAAHWPPSSLAIDGV